MKIFWLVNTIFPYPAEQLNIEKTVFGGWLNSLLNGIIESNEISEIAIVSLYNGTSIKKYKDKKIVYYLIPTKNQLKYSKNLSNELVKILDEFSPDLVHIHGTEYPQSLSAIEACNKRNIKNLVSVQGLVSKWGLNYNYFAGLPLKNIMLNITLRDIYKGDPLFLQPSKFRKRGKYEIEVLKKTNCIVGRTSWDEAHSYDICRVKKYKKCYESLRECFYGSNWKITDIERNTIFMSQASFPIKGFHKMILAAKIIKDKYPNIKIYVAGADIIKNKTNSFFEKIKITGYGKFLKKQIIKNKLESNIIFTGMLNEKQILDMLLKTHVFVQSSSLENSPNSLGEAMLIGMPCVASYVGGVSDMLLDKKEGLLYPFNEHEMLAKYVMDIFENDDYAIFLGKNAQEHAKKTHNIEKNSKKMINIYKELLGDKNDKKDKEYN